AIAAAAQHIRALATIRRRGPCTALVQAVQRALIRSQHVIVITDGASTCPGRRTPVRVPVDGHLLFLVLPSQEDGADAANVMLDRLAGLESSFPGSRALLAEEATPAFWLRIK